MAVGMRRLSPYKAAANAAGACVCCRVSWKGSKKRKKKDSDKLDYYKLLGLENTRWMATDSQIKKGELSYATLRSMPSSVCGLHTNSVPQRAEHPACQITGEDTH